MSNKSYRHTIKATAILSGAQLIEALLSLVRAKIVATLLGPAGIAMNSIYQTTLNTFFQFTSLGMPQSSVRSISSNIDDREKTTQTINVFIKIMKILAISALIIFLLLASTFNKLSFGKTGENTMDFIILSIAIASMTLSYANITILQGTKQLLSLGKTTIIGACISLLFAIPLYILLKHKGIVWAITIGYIISFLISLKYTKQLKFEKVNIPWNKIWEHAAPMIKLGVIIMISSVIINLYSYLTNVLLRYFGSLEDVGYYQAAYSLTYRNFAILSAALFSDYYPRLSSQLKNKVEFNNIINEQAEILILIISYVSMILIIFAPWIIELLLSKEFYIIRELVLLISYSFVFRIIWLTLSYVALAKGDKKTYLVYDALIGNGFYFIINILFYHFWGLQGIGFSCIAGTIFVSALLLIVYGRKYSVFYKKDFWICQLSCIAFLSLFMAIQLIDNIKLYYSSTIIIFIMYSIYTYQALNKRLEINSIIKKYTKK